MKKQKVEIETEKAQDQKKSDLEDENLIKRGHQAFYLIAIAAAVSLALYLYKFALKDFPNNLTLANDQGTWGQFGDFMGGFLNPIVGIVTVYLVLVNVRMQRKELRNSLEELRTSNNALTEQIRSSESQAFEQTFFTWLNSYQNIVASITYTDSSGNKTTGRDALFAAHYRYLGDDEAGRAVINKGLPAGDHYRIFRESGRVHSDFSYIVQAALLQQWEIIYKNIAHHIGSMFRTLYRLLRWIDEQPNSVLSPEQKWHYISIARSQLSDIELLYLFYNGFTHRGKSFTYIINQYALFDNLDIKQSYQLVFMKDFPESPFILQAYDSALARSSFRGS